MGILALHFFPKRSRINTTIITDGMYHRGSANIAPNSQNIVNRLWVKGGKAVSEPYPQDITVGTEPIPLFYSPRSPISVVIDGATKTLGIQNIDSLGSHDFLINASGKLLIPDLCTSGSGTIIYCYEYPIKILLEEPESQQQYGIFEDTLEVDTDDKILALEKGLIHLYKYSQPVLSGSLKPFSGVYKAGEVIKIELSELNIDALLQIKEVTYESLPFSPVVITLQLETPERDISNILKDMQQRIANLEKTTYQNEEGPIERYIAKEEYYYWEELTEKIEPIKSENWLFWNEDVEKSSHLLLLPSGNLYPSETLYP